jgi:hypothetical protein
MASRVRKAFSRNLRRYMRAQDKGIADVAKAVGCYYHDARNWVNGASMPGMLYTWRLCKYLGVTLDDLMDGAE